MALRLALTLEPGAYAICRLAPLDPLPPWALAAAFYSITRTSDEMSVVVPESVVPRDVVASRGWWMIRFAGPMPLDQTGILASVIGPLAAARVSVLSVATYDTDYVLVPADQRGAALKVLEAAGHTLTSV